MFRSIQWKIIAIFLLLTVSVMIVVGTFLLQNISAYYYNDFSSSLNERIFTGAVTDELKSVCKEPDATNKILDMLNAYSVRMGIDSFRNCYLLNQSLEFLGGTSEDNKVFTPTQNLLLALSGKKGDLTDKKSNIMDYALPVYDGETLRYIIYITDTKVEINEIITNMFINILWALLFGLIISAILGFFLSRTIISPISTLQHKSLEMAQGDFGHKIEVRSRDEIGQLTVAFNNMALRINNNMEEIQTEKNKIEAILLHMTDAVAAFDSSGRLIHINPAGKKLLSDCSFDTFDALFNILDTNVSLYRILYIDPTETVERNIEYRGKVLKAFFAPFNTERSAAAGVVVVFQDITRSQLLENARREFVANVSHELRTPLTTIKSYAETVYDMQQEEDSQSPVLNFIKVIEKEADRMARLVKDLLTLSQLDSSQKPVRREKFNLEELAKNVSEKLSHTARESGHIITFTSSMQYPDCFGEPDAIEQVLTNIISNAVKYTPGGGHIMVTCEGDFSHAVIRVRDNGIGIPKEDLPRVFERFYRVDKARSRKSGGTGLGLAIAKEIVTRHNGTITIESPHQMGTLVTITLPLFKKSE